MIIVNIYGGLGNQLFQYAAGKSLAHHHGIPLKLDTSFYQGKTKRHFDLDSLNITSEIALASEVEKFKNRSLFERASDKLLPVYKRQFFMEPHFQFYKSFFKISNHAYLTGLWQSERYFQSIKDIIRKEFMLKPEVVKHLSAKAETMQRENSVAVHIRRGDYLLTKNLKPLSIEYYKNALSLLQTKTGDAKIYFFSDDIDWVRNNFVLNTPHEFVSDRITSTHFEDFYLMQNCRHNIIANSTFSWWAAWLNSNNEKLVIAPEVWFKIPGSSNSDMLPEDWLKI